MKPLHTHYSNGLVAPEIEKEYYRVRGELYSLCRAKVKRLYNTISQLKLHIFLKQNKIQNSYVEVSKLHISDNYELCIDEIGSS